MFGGGSLSQLARETSFEEISSYPLASWARQLQFAKKHAVRCVGERRPRSFAKTKKSKTKEKKKKK